jgi:outer membrane PBP1 activator LpoA protein
MPSTELGMRVVAARAKVWRSEEAYTVEQQEHTQPRKTSPPTKNSREIQMARSNGQRQRDLKSMTNGPHTVGTTKMTYKDDEAQEATRNDP